MMEMGCNQRNKFNAAAAVFLMAVVLTAASPETEERHHFVVGGDRGWETTNFNGYGSSSPKIFRVGDVIWFTYSAAQDNIVEVGSREEYESCDLRNPIKMYTDGLNKIPLDGEGIRYFASGNMDHCKSGLKLPVTVLPRHAQLAQAPSMGWANAPSAGLAQSPYIGAQGPLMGLASLAQSPYIGGQDYGPISSESQSPSENGWESGLAFNVMEKWVKRELVDRSASGPESGGAPINTMGLFSILAVGLTLHLILSYYY